MSEPTELLMVTPAAGADCQEVLQQKKSASEPMSQLGNQPQDQEMKTLTAAASASADATSIELKK